VGLALDQITKLLVFGVVELEHPHAIGPTVIPGFFFITPRLNPGMAWSMGAKLGSAAPALLILVNLAICSMVVAYRERWAIVHRGRKLFDLAMGSVLAGALGNLADRAHWPHQVMDFFHFRFFGWDYPIFNVADIFIVAGVCAFVYWSWRVEPPEPARKATTA
jgi:signal peptidase II